MKKEEVKNEKGISPEQRLLKSIFNVETVNEVFKLAKERGEKVTDNFEFPRSGKTSHRVLGLVYDYMVSEIEKADDRIKFYNDRIEKLLSLNSPEIIVENEKLNLNMLQGKIKGYKELATLVYQLSLPALVGASNIILQETLDILTSKSPCFDCRYYLHSIEEDGDDSCLLGFDPVYRNCENNFALDDEYIPFWEMKRNVMQELGKSYINDEEVIKESARRFNAKRTQVFEKGSNK